MFNPARGAKKIKEAFIDYVTTALNFPLDGDKDTVDFGKKFRRELENKICKGPYVDINTNFEKGATINDLIGEGILSPLFKDIEANKPNDGKVKKSIILDRPLYSHQEKAIRLLNDNKNIVVTSGTGSGKTECFLYPLINSLLREKEQGTLSKPGVRAIFIYPMNALANDQMKRLRYLLMEYPDIRFGVFTGDTEQDGDKKNWFNNLHFNEPVEKLRWPLPNEPITRKEMIDNPPHILCTNYAMLEYMLLTPNRGAIFKDANVKFIVLDEAHTYSGATGMETSLLIRRLIARINSNHSHPQYILTSATLGEEGESEVAINTFAENLTGEKFGVDSIIYGHREPFYQGEETLNIPIEFFNDCSVAKESDFENIFKKYNLPFDNSRDYQENLFYVCSCCTYYKTLRLLFSEPVVISVVAKWLNLTEDEVVSFLHVCSLCKKKNAVLVDLRFHFFVRTLEGFYCCFTGDKEAFIERKEYIQKGNVEDRVFEISICKNCGDIAIIGYIEDENGATYLKTRETKLHDYNNEKEPKFFHLVKSKIDIDSPDKGEVDNQEAEETDLDADDEDELAKQKHDELTEVKGADDYWLCPHCGEISLVNDGFPTCKHDKKVFLRVRAYSDKVKHSKDRCLYCFNGEYNKFYIGTESATSALAAALFEELPEKQITVEVPSPIPGFKPEEYIKDAGKQFLAFSDSRAEAAYFASYLDKRYENLIEKRLLIQLLETHKKELVSPEYNKAPWTLNVFAKKLSELMHSQKSFRDDLLEEPNESDHKQICDDNAWKTILKEAISSKRSNSLQSLGFLTFEYLGNTEPVIKQINNYFFPNLSFNDVEALLNELAMTFVYFGAIVPDNYSISPEIKKEIFFVDKTKGITKSKSSFSLPYVGNWLPMARENDPKKYYNTYRLELVLKAIGDDAKINEANKFLAMYFDFLINKSNKYHAVSIDGSNPWYALPTSSITIKIPGQEESKWYRCQKCGRITTINLLNKCPITKCEGDLIEVDNVQDYLKNNYYLKFYKFGKERYLRKMLVKEHTAQLSKKSAAKYQNEFEKNNINALSCSTTFEMGVDVGELETVFLRDIPPSTANYAQRAGRAGRSKDSAAFVLAFAKLSSHDFNFYDNPPEMINGEITPPYFRLDNPKIVYRHIYSTCFGYFFNKNPEFFQDEEQKQRPICYFVENGGLDAFKQLIASHNNELSKVLKDSFSDLDEEFGISDFSGEWVDELIGPNGRLTIAKEEYDDGLAEFDSKIQAIKISGTKNPDLQIGFVKNEIERYKGTTLIDFLVQANILPKYGFPIDTVQLKMPGNLYDYRPNIGDLRLGRDMSQAISDYAPGSKVIADDKMYTSRYILKYWKNGEKDFDKLFISYCECGTLNVSNIENPVNKLCAGCKSSLNGVVWEEAICPKAGMVVDQSKPEEVPLVRPKKAYRSDYYFIEEDHASSEVALDFNANLVTAISSRKDKIIVTSAKGEPFYVCPWCGYSYGRNDKIRKPGGKIDKQAMNVLLHGTAREMIVSKKHNKPSGKECGSTRFEKKALFHAFNTDIIQLIFNGKKNISETEAISVLYSLIDAVSNKLHVERGEISGVVRVDKVYSASSNYRFILFDNVPGGAGHVKQLLENNYLNLASVIDYAYEKSKNCTCDPQSSCYKCLRTYDNQKYHDVLSRELVVDFLEPYYRAMPTKHISTKPIIKQSTPYSYPNWNPFFNNFSDVFTKKAEQIISTLKLPDLIFASIEINNQKIPVPAVLAWEDEGIYIFSKDSRTAIENINVPSDIKLLIGDDMLDVFDLLPIKE